VQTRDGGYLAVMNPFDVPVARKELPKLAMHLSKPFILRDHNLPGGGGGGGEVFQRLCAGGAETLLAKLRAHFTMDDDGRADHLGGHGGPTRTSSSRAPARPSPSHCSGPCPRQ
jgi:hypothetical protein